VSDFLPLDVFFSMEFLINVVKNAFQTLLLTVSVFSDEKMDNDLKWYFIGNKGAPSEGNRLHVRVNNRYITIFRHKGELSAIDSICHHAGGPLTLGPVQDIEDLGIRVVLCPWHKFMVSIKDGVKAYQGVEFVNGKPVNAGWKLGKVVQRAHKIVEIESGVYIVSIIDIIIVLFCLISIR